MVKVFRKGRVIILDETLEAEKILSSPNPVIDYNKMLVIGKYFYYEKGFSKRDVEEKILEYCSRNETFNIYFFRDMIDRVLRDIKKRSIKKDGQNVAITKKEISMLKVLPHKIYRIALYMLFISKFEKYQKLSINKIQRPVGFKTYCNYPIETIIYSLEKSRGDFNRFNKEEEKKIAKILLEKEVAKPVFLSRAFEMLIADFESKDVEFVIESIFDFDNQIKYYCLKCGGVCKKSKKHDFCEGCYQIDLRNRKTEQKRKERSVS